ncbi:MAG: hypothetical protein ACRDPY_22770 [Streptosporangiaceae bacterium]
MNLTLFNFEGTALPSIGIFQNPAQVCEENFPSTTATCSGGA